MNTKRSSSIKSEGNNQGSTVLLFGEVLADIFPDRTVLGGAPFNVARHLKAFRQNPILITSLGRDPLRDEVLNAMSRYEMDIMGVQLDNSHPTGTVQVHIEHDGHRFEILPQQAYDYINATEVHKAIHSIHPELVYFGTLAQRHNVSRQALETVLNGTEAAKFLDINLRAPWYDKQLILKSLQFANVVKLNDDELTILTEMFELPGSDTDDQVKNLLDQFNLEKAVITCGAAGAWQINRDGCKFGAGVKNMVSSLVDTVGAGDGFAAIFILGSLKQWPLTKTLERATDFAGAICEIRGAIPDHPDFYDQFTWEWDL